MVMLCALTVLVVGGLGLAVLAARGMPGEGTSGGAPAVVPGLLAAAAAALGGSLLLLRARRAVAMSDFRRWTALTLLIWAVGQVVHCRLQASPGAPSYPDLGTLLELLAVPTAIAATLTLPRASPGSRSTLRVVLDGGLLSVSTGLLIWRSTSGAMLATVDAAHVLAALVMLIEVLLATILVVYGVRDLDAGTLLVAAGAVSYVAGDLTDMLGHPERMGGLHWPTQVLYLLAWPAIFSGAAKVRPRGLTPTGTTTDVDPDARVTMVTTTASLLLLALGVGSIIAGDPRWPRVRRDLVSWCLVLAAIGLLWARELLNTRLRLRLVGRLHREASCDPLTGLANRRLLTARLNAIPADDPWCLLAFDLDGFKGVNDLLGHAVGDRLLCAVGDRLVRTLPRSAVIARTGGDEFAVLVPGGLQDGVTAAETVLSAVRRSCWDVEGVNRLPVTASVGLTAVSGLTPTGTTIAALQSAMPRPEDTPAACESGAAAADREATGHTIQLPVQPGPVVTAPSAFGAGSSGPGASGPGASGPGSSGPGSSAGAAIPEQPGRAVPDVTTARPAASGSSSRAAGDCVPEPAPSGDCNAAPSGFDPLSALSAAGAALLTAKAAGRDRVEIFDGASALLRARRLALEERLRAAVEEGRIDVQFQPIVDLPTGAITGVEALARWKDVRLGVIPPQEFIPIAEQTGLVDALGTTVLHRALRQARQYRLPALGIRLSCNASPLQLLEPEFHDMVEAALAEYEIPPEWLQLEVTEAVLVEENGPAVQTLRRLAEVGVTVAIDDFGTGYSALGYLRRMPAQVLKLDRSLTSALVDEPQARAITRAVVDLGRSLEMAIVAEGIETSDVADAVARMGVGYAQGTLYGSAMSMEDVVRLRLRPTSRRPTPRGLPA
jgi:diguanylate cyclase (GGDEF)-like protein